MTAKPLHIVVLAAGEGKRMKSARPKVLLPLAGQPMLAHVLAAARALRPQKIHVVHGHRGEQVIAAFSASADPERAALERVARKRTDTDGADLHRTDLGWADLHWIHQPEQRGTGHAMQLAIPAIPDAARVLILYGDVPLIRAETLRPLVEAPAALAVLTADLHDPRGYGRVVLDAEGRVQAIVEDKDCSADQRAIATINTGVVAADADALRGWLARLDNRNAQGEFYLTDVFAFATGEKRPAIAVACLDADEIAGANDPWQLAELERSYRKRRARALCADGVRLTDPARIDVRGEVVVGQDVEIDVDVILEGNVQLGDEVRIGPFCRVRASRLAAGTVVRPHCDIDGIVTHGACVIGPFARLRPGTEIAAGAHVGNFVEVKNASIGPDSKVNHLSYIGDATIGSGVNVGAGTITCNYDGVSKHRTVIEDGAFIGSNSALVAPVTIGKDATIGAGSTINKNAPAGELTVSRGRQTTIKDWKRPQKS